MKILYAQKMIFPNHIAHALHTSLLAANLATAGARVCLFPGIRKPHSPRILDDFYAALGVGECPGLLLRHIPSGHKGLYGALFRLALWREACASFGQEVVFLASSVKEAALALSLRRFVPRKRPIPVVFEIHHLLSRLKEGPEARQAYACEKKAFLDADLVVFVSEALQNDARGYLPEPRQAIVSHLGFNDRVIVPSSETPNGGTRKEIVYLGSLRPGKGVAELVAALHLLPENYHLTIIGGRPASVFSRLREQVLRLGMENRVRFAGHVPHSEVARHISPSAIFAIPLTTDTDFYSPMKMYEAVGYHLPIVSTPIASVREVLRHNHNAVFSRDTSPESFAEALRSLAEDDGLCQRIRQANAQLSQSLKASFRATELLGQMRALVS